MTDAIDFLLELCSNDEEQDYAMMHYDRIKKEYDSKHPDLSKKIDKNVYDKGVAVYVAYRTRQAVEERYV